MSHPRNNKHVDTKPICSIVIPVCDEEGNLPVLYEQLLTVTETEPLRWEFIFVDDGSNDGSFAVLGKLHSDDARVKALRFSRNFGSHVAIAAGLQVAAGDIAIIMAADLQDPPQVIHRFLERWREGYQVVWGVRSSRRDPPLRRLFATVFYWLIRRVALPTYPARGTGSFCLIDRQVIDTFDSFKERNRVTFGLIAWSGFRQTEVAYERPRRHAGQSKWPLGRQVKAAIDTFLAFSYAPVRYISLLGIVISLCSFAFAFYVLARWWLVGTQVPGWPSLVLSVLFLGGVQLVALGILGEYLWRILEEARGRPLFVVQERLGMFDRRPGETVATADLNGES
jgi:glycosyltransferase involved in cell wall biosynthesis